MPAAKSDAVAEAALGALGVLLARTHPADGEQLTGLLQRLLPVASLPRGAAAEEVRLAMHSGLRIDPSYMEAGPDMTLS